MALLFPSSPTHLDNYTDPNQAIWQYDSDGPYWTVITSTTRKNFSGIKRSSSGTFDLTTSYTAVDFDTADFSVDSYYVSDSRFQAPTTGFYRLSIILNSNSNGEGSSYTIQIRKNGIAIDTSTLGPNQFASYDETLDLVAGDYVEVWAKETTGTGGFTTNSLLTFYRIGYSPGTGISNHSAFSGVRATLTLAASTTSTPTATSWAATDFNANANVLGDLYWFNSVPTRITVRSDGYYKIRCFVKAGTSGSSNSYTATIRKNGSTSLTTVNLSPNDFVDLDEIYSLVEDDYLELMISNSDNTGNILPTTYLELVREGV